MRKKKVLNLTYRLFSSIDCILCKENGNEEKGKKMSLTIQYKPLFLNFDRVGRFDRLIRESTNCPTRVNLKIPKKNGQIMSKIGFDQKNPGSFFFEKSKHF